MPTTTRTVFSLDSRVLAALKQIHNDKGVPIGEQIRRGVAMWLSAQGVTVRGAEIRAGGKRTRKKKPKVREKSK
jgi:hypothetical protein